MTWGGWASQFCRHKPGPGDPSKMGAPTLPFLVYRQDYKNPWPLQNGKPGMGTHLGRRATWNNEALKKAITLLHVIPTMTFQDV